LRKSIFLVLVLVLTLINIGLANIIALPEANKPPFYDYDASVNDWWEQITGVITEYILPDSCFEYSFVLYNPYSYNVNITVVKIFINGKIYTYDNNITVTPGFHVLYFAGYHTDADHTYFAMYTDNGQKEFEYTDLPYEGSSSGYRVQIHTTEPTYASKKRWYKALSSGQAYTFSALWGALNWLLYDPTNPQIKAIRVESDTSPATVQIFSSDGNKFYEQGFSNNEQTYIFCNDTKITVFAYGPAGSKSVDIEENGLWIVIVNSSLTDIYLNSTETTGDGQESGKLLWLNTTVKPSEYEIRYVVDGYLNASAKGNLSKQYQYNTTVVLEIWYSGYKKYSEKIVLLYNVTKYFMFSSATEKWITVSCSYPPENRIYIWVDNDLKVIGNGYAQYLAPYKSKIKILVNASPIVDDNGDTVSFKPWETNFTLYKDTHYDIQLEPINVNHTKNTVKITVTAKPSDARISLMYENPNKIGSAFSWDYTKTEYGYLSCDVPYGANVQIIVSKIGYTTWITSFQALYDRNFNVNLTAKSESEQGLKISSKWYGWKIKVLDKNHNPIPDVTVQVLHSYTGGITGMGGWGWYSIGEAITDSNGIALIVKNGTLPSGWASAYQVIVRSEQGEYRTWVHAEQNKLVEVTVYTTWEFKYDDLGSQYQKWSRGTAGQVWGTGIALNSLIPLIIVIGLVSILINLTKRRR